METEHDSNSDDLRDRATGSMETLHDAAATVPDAFPEEESGSGQPVPESSIEPVAAVLTDDLRDRIVKQVEYYFSDENLPTDKFLLKQVKKNKQGFVPIPLIASFRKMKKLTQNVSLIEAALRTSAKLVVSPDGKKVKRLHSMPHNEVEAAKSRTVVVENLAEDHSTEFFQRVFGKIGNIRGITIHDPNSIEESTTSQMPEVAVSNKLHALVEYEFAEAAESAVAALNDEKNWRSGLRVELLLKRMVKYGLIQKGHKEAPLHRNNNAEASNPAGDTQKANDDQDEEIEKMDILPADKSKKKKKHKNRGRPHHQQSTNGSGHAPSSSGLSILANKPPPGPRMPDGTRGFTMGRGRPLNNHL